MRIWTAPWLLLALLAAPAQAAINGPLPFEAEYPFSEGLGDGSGITVASGALQAATRSEGAGAFAFFEARGLRFDGLTRVCWDLEQYAQDRFDGRPSPRGCAVGDLAIVASPEGGAAFRFPIPVTGRFEAAHALGAFFDFALDRELRTLGLGKSLVAPSVDGVMDFAPVASFGDASRDPDPLGMAQVVPVTGGTTLEVLDGEAIVHTASGREVLFFEGEPRVPPFATPFAVLVFGEGSEARFTPASLAAAREGLDLSRVSAVLGDDEAGLGGELPVLPEDLAPLLAGMAVHAPGNLSDPADLLTSGAFYRVTELAVTAGTDGLTWAGQAPLQIQSGAVVGADGLAGPLPWWSYLFWAIAIGGLVARVILKPEKRRDPWDKFRWAGSLLGLVAGLVVLLLFDNEVHAIWGMSLLKDAPSGAALGVIAIAEMVPIVFIGVGISLPLQSILKSGVRLARLGSLANAAAVVAPFLAFLLGAGLFLDYAGWALDLVVKTLG